MSALNTGDRVGDLAGKSSVSHIVSYILLLRVYLLCSYHITDHYSDPM